MFAEILKEFINTYGIQILGAVLTFIGGYIGLWAKSKADKYVNDKTKKAVAKTVVQFVEQVYKDLHGEDKLNAALATASEMLAEKGITVTDLEMRVLIESAVAEFNGAFYNIKSIEPETSAAE